MFTMMRQQTPDMHIDIEDVIASGTIDVFTFDDAGMNTEPHGVYDIMGTMGQLGLMPGAG
jgi:hypothetical protein